MTKITSRIKFIGSMLSLLLILLIGITIYLNQYTKNDGYVVNIAGKERMLTQKMAKELFLNMSRQTVDWHEFSLTKVEFLTNLDDLRLGNEQRSLTPPPTPEIAARLEEIKRQSAQFLTLSNKVALHLQNKTPLPLALINDVYTYNNALVALIDETVKAYALASETKKQRLEIFQYLGGAFTLIAVILTVLSTRRIETEFDKFLLNSKEVADISCEEVSGPKRPLAEGHELDQAGADFKFFLEKVEKVLEKARNALEESEVALGQLEGTARVMENHLDTLEVDINAKKEIEQYIDKSENLTIHSLDDIAGAKALLDKFQTTLAQIVKKMA